MYIFLKMSSKRSANISSKMKVKSSKNKKYLTQHDIFKIYKNPQVESLYNANYSV